MIFNATSLAKDSGTDRLQFGLQVFPLDAAKPVAPIVYTLYLPVSAASITNIVFAPSAPDDADGTVWVRVSESSGSCYAEIPAMLGKTSGIYPLYFAAVQMYSDGEWWGLENAALYDVKKQKWVAL